MPVYKDQYSTISTNSFTLNHCTLTNGVISIDFEYPPYYYDMGFAESNVIDLGIFFYELKKITITSNKPTGTDIKLHSKSSNDGISFLDEYAPVNSDGTINSPNNRYLKIKIELYSGRNIVPNIIYDFVSGETSKFVPDSRYQLNGSMAMKETQTDFMTKDVSWTFIGSLHRKQLDRNKFLYFDSINIILT